MNRDVEIELRQDVKEINTKLTEIQVAIAELKTKQSIGTLIFNACWAVIIAGAGGLFGAYFSR